MNWYSFTRYLEAAQQDSSAEAYLARIGVSEETISYVTTMQPQMKQKAVGFLTKNPQTDSNTLMQMFQTPSVLNPPNLQQKAKSLNTQQEMAFVNRFSDVPDFVTWALIQLKKLRTTAELQGYAPKSPVESQYYLDSRGNVLVLNDYRQIFDEIYDWYSRGVLRARAIIEQPGGYNEQDLADRGIPNPNIQLDGLTFEQAWDQSEIWHERVAGRGDGKEYYGEKKEDIVYGPNWQNPEFRGWTIKKVYGKNNLDAEGNKVGHCVGDYCDSVNEGKTRIFSLRDPKNVPYVTMEVEPNSWNFRQIYGNGPKTGNREPGDNLKKALGEWMKTLPGVKLPYSEGFDYDDMAYSSLDEDLYEAVYRQQKGYGLPVNIVDWDFDDAYKEVMKHLNDDRSSRIYNDGGRMTKHVAKALANIAVDSDKQKLEHNLITPKNMKSRAVNLVWHSKKYPFYAETPLEKLNKHALEQLEPLLAEQYPIAEKQLRSFPNEREPFRNEQDKIARIRKKAYENLQEMREIDIKYTEEDNDVVFDRFPLKFQKKFMAKALDDMFSIGKAYQKRQANEDGFYVAYDDSNIQLPDQPDEDDFSTPEEYQNAMDAHEEEVNNIRDNEADEWRQNSLPYCLDDRIVDWIEINLAENPLAIPEWVPEFFRTKETNLFEQANPEEYEAHYEPQILWALERAATKRKEIAEQQMANPIRGNKKATGWYGSVKESQGSDWSSTYLSLGHQWTDADHDEDSYEMAKIPPPNKNDALWVWRNNQLEVVTAGEWHQQGNRGFYFAHDYVFDGTDNNVKGRYDANKNVVSLFKRKNTERFGNNLYQALKRRFPNAPVIEAECPI